MGSAQGTDPGTAGALAGDLARLAQLLDAPTQPAGPEPAVIAAAAARLRALAEALDALAPAALAERRLPVISDELAAIRHETEKAVARIVAAAAEILSAEPDAAELVSDRAVDILEACCFGDITAQRITRAFGNLQVVEARVRRVAEACGDPVVADDTAAEIADRTALLFGPGPEPLDQARADSIFRRA